MLCMLLVYMRARAPRHRRHLLDENTGFSKLEKENKC